MLLFKSQKETLFISKGQTRVSVGTHLLRRFHVSFSIKPLYLSFPMIALHFFSQFHFLRVLFVDVFCPYFFLPTQTYIPTHKYRERERERVGVGSGFPVLKSEPENLEADSTAVCITSLWLINIKNGSVEQEQGRRVVFGGGRKELCQGNGVRRAWPVFYSKESCRDVGVGSLSKCNLLILYLLCFRENHSLE